MRKNYVDENSGRVAANLSNMWEGPDNLEDRVEHALDLDAILC